MVKFNLGSFYQSCAEETKGDNDNTTPQPRIDPYLWRHDPEESHSDWTIVVSIKNNYESSQFSLRRGGEAAASDKDGLLEVSSDSVTSKYHIHKYPVGYGPRSSQYFRRLFNTNQELTESMTSTSLIELEESAAVAFPQMLDFIYSIHTTDVVASTKTAVALRYLANYFVVPELFDSVNQFVQNDLDKNNFETYLQEALLYDDDIIIDAALELASKDWQEEDFPAYMEKLPPSKHFHLVKHLRRELQGKDREIEHLTKEARNLSLVLRRQDQELQAHYNQLCTKDQLFRGWKAFLHPFLRSSAV